MRRLGRRVGTGYRSSTPPVKKVVYRFFTQASYRKYLLTPHFRNLVKKMFPKGRTGKCVVCNKKNQFLYPHHRGYECIGKEKIGVDLIKVCKKCNYELTYQEDGRKTAPTRLAYMSRERFLKARNRSISYRLGQQRPADWVNKGAAVTAKVIKSLW